MTKPNRAAVLTGVVLCLGLVAISAALNFRVAYRTGDTELDAWIYGSGAAIADGLKDLADIESELIGLLRKLHKLGLR